MYCYNFFFQSLVQFINFLVGKEMIRKFVFQYTLFFSICLLYTIARYFLSNWISREKVEESNKKIKKRKKTGSKEGHEGYSLTLTLLQGGGEKDDRKKE